MIEFTLLNAEDQREQCRLLIALQEEELGHWEPLRNATSLSIRMNRTFGNGIPLKPTVEELEQIIDKIGELEKEIERMTR